MSRKLTIDEALKELRRRHLEDSVHLDSPSWRVNHGDRYSYTKGHADALDEVIIMLETNYRGEEAIACALAQIGRMQEFLCERGLFQEYMAWMEQRKESAA
jgi:hypothetical protein